MSSRKKAPLAEYQRAQTTIKKGDSFARLDCGCELGKQDGMFLIKPCSPHCPVYLYVVAETRRLGHSMHYIPVKE